MFVNEQLFISSLIDKIRFSTNYEGFESSESIKKEFLQFERMKLKCDSNNDNIKRNSTNSSTIDCFINDIPIQIKYCSIHNTDSETYSITMTKSAGSLDGQRLKSPYSINDDFEYVIAEIGGTIEEPEKYHNYFCSIPKEELINQNILKSDICPGKVSMNICPPDYSKEHWSKKFWIAPNQLFILKTNKNINIEKKNKIMTRIDEEDKFLIQCKGIKTRGNKRCIKMTLNGYCSYHKKQNPSNDTLNNQNPSITQQSQ